MVRSTLSLPLLLSLSACTGEPVPLAHALGPVIEGQRAGADQVLSTVALTDGGGEAFCTGTLIAPTVVITAAHCLQTEDERGWIDASDVEVAFNTLDAAPAGARQRRAVRSATPHPSFLQAPEGNDAAGLQREDDIAVLVLSAAVEQPVTPILPSALLGRLVQGTPLTVAGYGQTDLQNEDAFGRLHFGVTPFIRHNGFELLAGGNGTDTCMGDSGGPAYVHLDGVRYLVGATARSAHDAQVDCGDRGIYTLVPSYQGWIDQVVGGEAQPLPEVEAEAGDEADEEAVDEEAGDEESGDEEAVDEAAGDDGEPDTDVCGEEGWYGDDECDDFCDRPDPDCAGDEAAEDDEAFDDEAADETDEDEADDAEADEAADAPVLYRDGRSRGCQSAPGGADAPVVLALGALCLLRRRRQPRA